MRVRVRGRRSIWYANVGRKFRDFFSIKLCVSMWVEAFDRAEIPEWGVSCKNINPEWVKALKGFKTLTGL